MPMFSREDVDLYYECHGSGAPLFLIAGLASDSQSWQPIIGDLAAHFRVIALDNRGVGRTIPQDAPTSIRAMADDCIALIDHLRLPSVHVLGHSMGGFIAQELAIRRADKVNALILAATASASCRRNNELFRGWADALATGANMSAWFRNLFYWIFSARFFDDENAVDEAVRFAIDYLYPQSAQSFRNQVDAIAAFDSATELSRLRARTLVVAGTGDLLFPLDACRTFANRVPGATFAAIDNAAHSLHMEQPRAFVDRVVQFLEKFGTLPAMAIAIVAAVFALHAADTLAQAANLPATATSLSRVNAAAMSVPFGEPLVLMARVRFPAPLLAAGPDASNLPRP